MNSAEVLLSLLFSRSMSQAAGQCPPWPAGSTGSNRQLGSGGKGKKSKLNSKQSPACISSGPAALGKCSSVPCIIYLPSLQMPRSSSYNEQMQMWNCHWRVNLCSKQICPALCLQVLQGRGESRSSKDAWWKAWRT